MLVASAPVLVASTLRNLLGRAGARGALANVEADRAARARERAALEAVLVRVPAPTAPARHRAA